MYKKMLFLISCVSVLALGGTNMVFGAGVWDTASGEGIEEDLSSGDLDTGSSRPGIGL